MRTKGIFTAVILSLCAGILLFGCGGGGGSSSSTPTTTTSTSTSTTTTTTTSTTGTVSGVIALPSNTNAKLFEVKLPLYVKLFSGVAHAAVITDLSTLTVTASGVSANPDASGRYTLSVSVGTNIEVTVTAPSGNVVLTAIVPSVSVGSSATQNVDSTSTAVALIYKQNTSLLLSQIEASSAVTNVKNAIESALTDTNVGSITGDSTVTNAVSTAVTSMTNKSPVISSGPTAGSSSISASGSTTISVTASDVDGDTLSYSWSASSGTISGSGASVTYTAPSTAGTYTISVMVSDSKGGSTSGSVSVMVIIPATITAIAAGGDILGGGHTCAVTTNGYVKCWGANGAGQLGNGTSSGPETCMVGSSSYSCSTIPVSVLNLSNAATIAVGAYHSCTRTTTGQVKCWGPNGWGNLGDGTMTWSSSPVSVSNLSGVTAVTAGGNHTCALTTTGQVKCWGINGYEQLGNGTATGPESCTGLYVTQSCSTTPVTVSGLSGVTAITAGGDHTCALNTTGQVKCWGGNNWGQLGKGTTIGPEQCTVSDGLGSSCSSTPVSVSGLSGVTAIAAGDAHTCAITSSGQVKCWGYNTDGRLGDGTSESNYTPVSVSGLSGVTVIAAGGKHTCALTIDGQLKCWGDNWDGQFGDGTTTSSYTPVAVADLTGANVITAGYYYTCAIISGKVKCWGNNKYGQLGNGTSTGPDTCGSGYACSKTPVSVSDSLYASSPFTRIKNFILAFAGRFIPETWQ